MYTLIGSALLGAVLMARGRPKTRCVKKSLLGPKTGATYQVEDFTDAGFIVVTSADGSRAIFQRKAATPGGGRGFAWQHGRGNPASLRAIYTDIMGEEPPKTTMGPKAVPNGARAAAPGPQPKSRTATRGTP
jgi:hypothetical protein